MRKTSKIPVVLTVLAILAIAGIVYVYPRVSHFLDVDTCLDSGGAWHHEQCVH
jgi:hypothetical protein